jgi:flagellar M-ring protein FliF
VPGSPEKIDRQLNAIRGLIAEEPERVAQVVKQWVMESK